jgi:hypothetical protein
LHINGNLSKFVVQKQQVMKRTRLFLAGALAVIGFMASSCSHENEPVARQHLYNNSTLVDGEGFTFFKVTYEKASSELAHAKYVLEQGVTSDAKAVAEQVVATYSELLPKLEQLAIDNHVILQEVVATGHVHEHAAMDSTHEVSFDAAAYVTHVQHEQKELINQFERASRNTNKELRSLSAEYLAAIKSIYSLAGGHEEEGAHH